MVGTPSLRDMVIVGQEDWDEIWRRNQFLIAGLARRFPATRFLFVELPFDLTYGLRSGQLLRRGSTVRRQLARMRQGVRSVASWPNIYTLVAPKLLPDAVSIGERLNTGLSSWTIRRAMARIGLRRPIFWTQNPFAASLLGRLGEQGVVYDVTDDWTALDGASPRFITRAKEGDVRLTNRADCVITCSQFLYERKQVSNPRTVLIPNGVDVDHYRDIGTPHAPVASRLTLLPRPVLGYTGSLHEARLDVGLVCALATARPDISLVFIGPNFLPQLVHNHLRAFPNIHLLGPVPYSEIPAYMQGCDGLMIPHRVSQFTESLNPIKLFEYLAAGLPVVATAVAGVRDYAGIIRVAYSPADFILLAGEILRDNAHFDATTARRLAHNAAWETRVAAVLEALGDSGILTRPQTTLANRFDSSTVKL